MSKLIHDIEKLEKISDGNIFINTLLDEIDSEILKEKICEETKCSLYFYNKQLEKVKEYLKQFNYKKTVSHKPYGRVLINIPSSEVIESFFNSVLPAYAVGNVVIVKPAKAVVNSTKILFNIFTQAIREKNSCFFLQCDRDEFTHLIKMSIIDMLYWTGGSKSASKMSSLCLENGIHFIAESEGNDILYVDETANVELAIKIIQESLTENNGFMCNSIRGAFVHPNLFQQIINNIFIKLVKNNITLSKDILQYVNSITCEETLFDNEDNPSICVIIKPDSLKKLNKEIFGSVIWISDRVDEYVNFVNTQKHKLTTTIVSEDDKHIKDLCEQIRIPNIFINKSPLSISMNQSWGGINKSGTHGSQSWFEKFTFKQIIHNLPEE